ncbi:MAG: hypothetical protein VCE74_09600 [Alphaproteobacteria bacterium]
MRQGRRQIRPRPYLGIDKADDPIIVPIHRDHRVDEKTKSLAVAGRIKSPTAFIATGKIDLRRVLHRNNAAAFTRKRDARRKAFDNPANADTVIVQKTVRRKFAGPAFAKTAQNDTARRHNTIQKPIKSTVNASIPNYRHQKPPNQSIQSSH